MYAIRSYYGLAQGAAGEGRQHVLAVCLLHEDDPAVGIGVVGVVGVGEVFDSTKIN